MRAAPTIACSLLALLAGACASVKTENKVETVSEIKPIEVKPIHIVLDINVKVDKDLDKFFNDVDKKEAQPQAQAQPAAGKPADQDPSTAPKAALTPEQQAEKDAAKARFAQRLPVISDLKKRAIVGENNQGLLQFMGQIKESEDVVAADNADRKAVYDRIAMRQGATPVLVAQQRAKRNAEKALPGEWTQDASGRWTQKQ